MSFTIQFSVNIQTGLYNYNLFFDQIIKRKMLFNVFKIIVTLKSDLVLLKPFLKSSLFFGRI